MNTLRASLVVLLSVAVPSLASAAEYRCRGHNVEKSGSTHYSIRMSGADFTVEKSGSTRGKARGSGNRYVIEASGSTLATVENGKISRSGSTWASVADAQKVYDCPPMVAAALWVLQKSGKL